MKRANPKHEILSAYVETTADRLRHEEILDTDSFDRLRTGNTDLHRLIFATKALSHKEKFSQLGVLGKFYSQSMLCHRILPSSTGAFYNAPFMKLTDIARRGFTRIKTSRLMKITDIIRA